MRRFLRIQKAISSCYVQENQSQFNSSISGGRQRTLGVRDIDADDLYKRSVADLRGETKGSKIEGKRGIKWDNRDGPSGHQPTASRCDLPQ